MDDTRMSAVVDMTYPLEGEALPGDHRFALAEVIAESLPWIRHEPELAVFAMHLVQGGRSGSGDSARLLLSSRSRLVVRVPRTRIEAMAELSGRTIHAGAHALRLGSGQARELLPHGTLYAHFVASDQADEAAFLASVGESLQTLEAAGCLPVCGRYQQERAASGSIDGYSLMLHGLTPGASRRILEHGIGPHRLMGCGVFLPHKSAAAVGAA